MGASKAVTMLALMSALETLMVEMKLALKIERMV